VSHFSGTAVKAFVILAVLAAGPAAASSPAVAWAQPPAGGLLTKADWQIPEVLPRRFRNHCAVDLNRRLAYCSDHCGSDYQFYYCSTQSFGCCHRNYGYCDWEGLLRCAP
jgi:hypothetical protein